MVLVTEILDSRYFFMGNKFRVDISPLLTRTLLLMVLVTASRQQNEHLATFSSYYLNYNESFMRFQNKKKKKSEAFR